MTLPLQVLAVLSVVGGLVIGFPGLLFKLEGWNLIDKFLAPILPELGSHAHAAGHGGEHALSLTLEWFLVGLSVAVAVTGILLAKRLYTKDPEFIIPKRLAERFAFGHRLLLNKYWVDELYEAVIIRPIHGLATFSWKVIDVWVIDGTVNLVAFCTDLGGSVLRFVQTGNVRNYALSVALGILLLTVMLW